MLFYASDHRSRAIGADACRLVSNSQLSDQDGKNKARLPNPANPTSPRAVVVANDCTGKTAISCYSTCDGRTFSQLSRDTVVLWASSAFPPSGSHSAHIRHSSFHFLISIGSLEIRWYLICFFQLCSANNKRNQRWRVYMVD